MDLVVMLGMMIASYYAIREVTRWMCPPLITVIDRLVGTAWRTVRLLVWRIPMRKLGNAHTIFLWGVVLAALSTIGLMKTGDTGGLPAVVILWLVVVAWWQALRWLARRRHQPRELPQRERRRDPRWR